MTEFAQTGNLSGVATRALLYGMKGRQPVQNTRPSIVVLLLAYAIWIGLIAVIATSSRLSFFAIDALVLVLFITLPYWAYRNWSWVTEDLPATFATVIVALMFLVLLTAHFNWDRAPSLNWPGKAGPLNPAHAGKPPYWLEFFVVQIAVYGTLSSWHTLRRWIARALGQTPSQAGKA